MLLLLITLHIVFIFIFFDGVIGRFIKEINARYVRINIILSINRAIFIGNYNEQFSKPIV